MDEDYQDLRSNGFDYTSEKWEADNYNSHKYCGEDSLARKLLDKYNEIIKIEKELTPYGYKRRYYPYSSKYFPYYEGYDRNVGPAKKDRRKLLGLIFAALDSMYHFLLGLGLKPDKGYARYYIPKKYLPRKYKLPKVWRGYYKRHIAPIKVISTVFPPEQAYADLDEFDLQHLRFIQEHLEDLSELDVLQLERQIEDRKVSVEQIKQDIKRHMETMKMTDREIEDQTFMETLTGKTPRPDLRKYTEFWREYMEKEKKERIKEAQKRKELRKKVAEEKEYYEALSKGLYGYKIPRKKQKLRLDSAKMLCDLLSSKRRREGKQ